MRAHSQRRVIWILNVLLGAGVLGMLGWIFLHVLPATADAAYLKPAWADKVVDNFDKTPPTDLAALKPPVSEAEIEEIDRQEFKTRSKKRFHWLYSGPMPPPPPPEAEEAEAQAPIEDDLGKLGRVALLIYIGPRKGAETASETVVFWEFKAGGERIAKAPGEWIRPKSEEPKSEEEVGRGGIKLVDVKPVAGQERVYELHYVVHKKDDEPPVKTGGVFVYNGNKALPPELERRIIKGLTKPAAADSGAAVASGGAAAGVTQPLEPGVPLDPSRLNPSVTYETQNRAAVEFDQATWDYFRDTDPDAVAKTVKTEVARDGQGKLIGLRITGISSETPADRFDVKPGDILVSIDGQPVKSRSDAMNIAQGLDPDTRLVKVVVNRHGRLITFNIDPRDPKTRRAARTLDNR